MYRRKDKVSEQTLIILAFRRRFSELNGLSCRRYGGSSEEDPDIYLTSGFVKRYVNAVYASEWCLIAEDSVTGALITALCDFLSLRAIK